MVSGTSDLVHLGGDEAQAADFRPKKGGWVTFPFILGSMMGMSVAIFGATANIIVYLVQEFNVDGVDAAQVSNIINGCINLAPIAGAVVSDSLLGCFAVVAYSSLLSLLGMVLFTLTATVRSLRPPPCRPRSGGGCAGPSPGQNAALYAAVALVSMGTGGTRFNLATMGANQFDEPGEQGIFFNWYFFVMYVAAIIGYTAVVYLQDGVSWGWGFAACAAANAAALIAFLLGTPRYREAPVPAEGGPYVGLARVLVAAARKWRLTAGAAAASPEAAAMQYYNGSSGEGKQRQKTPTGSFRFLNRAALRTPADGDAAEPWRLCTVDQVEDLKAILRLLPLWSSSIFLATSIGIVSSFTVLQALTLDRRLGSHFTVPAGSLVVAALAASALSLPLLDRCLYPAWGCLVGRAPTPLQRLGVGHVVNAAAVAAAALVERRRLGVARTLGLARRGGAAVPMSAVWLLAPLAAVGLGEAFHFPGQVALYYQEFPESLRSTATGMVGLLVAVGFYVSTAVVDLVRRTTDWLPEDINAGRLDKLYWMLAAVAAFNFAYFMFCSTRFRYDNVI